MIVGRLTLTVRSSLRFLRHPAPGRLLVVAHRPRQTPDRLRAALARAAQSGAMARVALGPLTPSDVDELFAGEQPDRRRRLHAVSGGNPFYLNALAARAAGDLAAAAHTAEGDVPEPVRAALLAELARLTPRQLLVIRACAVAGDRAEAGLIARTAELDLAEVLPLLDVVAAHDMIRPVPSGGRFEFRHPLVRRVAYDAAGAGRRIGAHARAAAALRAVGRPPPSWPTTWNGRRSGATRTRSRCCGRRARPRCTGLRPWRCTGCGPRCAWCPTTRWPC